MLTGEPGAVNSLAEPEKVSPKRSNIDDVGRQAVNGWEFPPHSVSVLRWKVK